jgi:hypothetical protein
MVIVDELKDHLGRWNRRLRLRRAQRCGWVGLNLGIIAGAANGLLGMLRADLLIADYFLQAVWITSLACVLGLVIGYLWPLTDHETAHYLDQQYRLMDRVSTAYELLSSDPEETYPLITLQRADTVRALGLIPPRASLPTRFSRRQGLVTAVLLVLLFLAPFLFRDNLAQAATQAAVAEAIQAEVISLESLIDLIDQDETLAEMTRDLLAEPLQEAAAELRETENLELAVAALDQAVEELRAIENQLAATNDLSNIGEKVDPGNFTTLESFLEALSAGDFGEAAAQLEALSPKPEDPGSIDLANELAEVAGAAGEVNPSLASALENAAQSVFDGDQQAATSHLNNAAEQLRSAGQQANASEKTDALTADILAGMDKLQAAGLAANSPTGAGQPPAGAVEGSGNPDSAELSEGSGSAAGDGADGNTSEQIGNAGLLPNNTQGQPGDGGLGEYERIYAPTNLGGENGPELSLPESGLPGELIQGDAPGAVPEPELSLVPYVDVFAQYETVYRKAIETGQVPAHLRDMVQQYFLSLAPD